MVHVVWRSAVPIGGKSNGFQATRGDFLVAPPSSGLSFILAHPTLHPCSTCFSCQPVRARIRRAVLSPNQLAVHHVRLSAWSLFLEIIVSISHRALSENVLFGLAYTLHLSFTLTKAGRTTASARTTTRWYVAIRGTRRFWRRRCRGRGWTGSGHGSPPGTIGCR